jgi:hypothetical protein
LPRPISWLPRLHIIARSVANSVRSHYDRHDLETLFELQPRAAQKLLEMLPTVQIGSSRLVDREVLASFLDRVRDADDMSKLFGEIRAEKAQVSRRRPRSLVRRDLDPIGIGDHGEPRQAGGELFHRGGVGHGDVCARPCAGGRRR